MSREENAKTLIDGVNEAEDRERGDQNIVTLSTGVQLKIKPVSKHFIFQVTSKFKKPEVPMYMNEAKGRMEENPSHPDYLEAQEQYIIDVVDATNDLVLMRGTEIHAIPDSVIKPNSKAWKSEMKILGLPMIDDERYRYLSWVKAIAATTDSDLSILMEEIGRLTGVPESDVEQAVERFRSVAGRETDQ
jgi:hypothetical protein